MPRQLPQNDPRKALPDRVAPDKSGRQHLVEVRQVVIAVPLEALPSLTVSYAAHELHPDGTPMAGHNAMESKTIHAADLPLRVRQGLAQFIDWCAKEMADEMIPHVLPPAPQPIEDEAEK